MGLRIGDELGGRASPLRSPNWTAENSSTTTAARNWTQNRRNALHELGGNTSSTASRNEAGSIAGNRYSSGSICAN